MKDKEIKESVSKLFGKDLTRTQLNMIIYMFEGDMDFYPILKDAEEVDEESELARLVDELISDKDGVRDQLRMIINN